MALEQEDNSSHKVNYTRLSSFIINNLLPVINRCSYFENSIYNSFSSIYKLHYSDCWSEAWNSLKNKFNYNKKNKSDDHQQSNNISKILTQQNVVQITLGDFNPDKKTSESRLPSNLNVKCEHIVLPSSELTWGEIIQPGISGNNLLDEAAFNNNILQLKTLLPIVVQEKGWDYIFQIRNNKGINFLNIAYNNRNAAVLNEVIKLCSFNNLQYDISQDQSKKITIVSNKIYHFVQQPQTNVLDIRFAEFSKELPKDLGAYPFYNYALQPVCGEYQFFLNESLIGDSNSPEIPLKD